MVRKIKNGLKLIALSKWISKSLIGLGIGFFAISGGLVIPNISAGVMAFAGWVAVITTVIDVYGDIIGSR